MKSILIKVVAILSIVLTLISLIIFPMVLLETSTLGIVIIVTIVTLMIIDSLAEGLYELELAVAERK